MILIFSPAPTARDSVNLVHTFTLTSSVSSKRVEPTRSHGDVCACVYLPVQVGLPCVWVFGMTWQPPALFKHVVGCAGSRIVRLGMTVVHAVSGTLWWRKEGAQRGQAASDTSPTEPKAPLVGLWTPEQAQGEMIMRTETVLHRMTHAIASFEPHVRTHQDVNMQI